MAYSLVPNAGQSLNATRDLIKTNFTILQPYGVGYSFFTVQSPAPTPIADTDFIYMAAFNGANELFVHKQTTSGLAEVPFTASKMSLSNATDSINGWGYLPNGLLVKWGTKQAPSAIIFATDVGVISGGPVYTQIFQTYVTPYWQGPVTTTPSVPFLASSGTTSAGNFTCFVTNYDATRSYLNYLVIGI